MTNCPFIRRMVSRILRSGDDGSGSGVSGSGCESSDFGGSVIESNAGSGNSSIRFAMKSLAIWKNPVTMSGPPASAAAFSFLRRLASAKWPREALFFRLPCGMLRLPDSESDVRWMATLWQRLINMSNVFLSILGKNEEICSRLYFRNQNTEMVTWW